MYKYMQSAHTGTDRNCDRTFCGMSYAVKYITNDKGEEEMKKRNVVKLVALGMMAATLMTGINVQAEGEKSGYSNNIP